MNTKIFCDIADLSLIKKFNKKKIVKGFTTNPSLMRNAGAKNYTNYSKKILKLTNKPVSCEVFADDAKNMKLQGMIISKWGKNVYVKVPVTNSKGKYIELETELNKKVILDLKDIIKDDPIKKLYLTIIKFFIFSGTSSVLSTDGYIMFIEDIIF